MQSTDYCTVLAVGGTQQRRPPSLVFTGIPSGRAEVARQHEQHRPLRVGHGGGRQVRVRFRVGVRVGVKVGVGARARFRADLRVGHGVDPVGLAVADDVVPG